MQKRAWVHTHETNGEVFAVEYSNHADPHNLNAEETTTYSTEQYETKFPQYEIPDSKSGTVIEFTKEK